MSKTIWVVGADTGVGKTLVSTSLVRILNARGIKTVGFKPYAGSRLIDVIDHLEGVAGRAHQMAGRDAVALAQASPLTRENMAEIVNPSWRIHHPGRESTVFIRKGSAALGTARYYIMKKTAKFQHRPDIQALNEGIKLPFAEAEVVPDLPADAVDALFQENQQAAYAHLQGLGPEVTVCEGAGRLLPVWEGCPKLNHLIGVEGGQILLFPDVNLDFNVASNLKSIPIANPLFQKLGGRQCLAIPIPVLSSQNRAEKIDAFLEKSALGRLFS